jgi:hypothetical protein
MLPSYWHVKLHGATGEPDWSEVDKITNREADKRNAKLNKERSVYRWVCIQIGEWK